MLDILVLALLAGVVLWRLIRTFGQIGMGDARIITAEYHILDPKAEDLAEQEQLSTIEEKLSPRVQQICHTIANHSPGFNIKAFLEGAKKAYEMMAVAFATNDLNTLKHLLSPELYNKFAEKIQDLQRQEYTQQLVFIGVDAADVIDASLTNNNTASFTIHFQSEQVCAIVDKNNNVISGDTKKTQKLHHKLVFAKSLDSFSTLWCIVESDLSRN